ncbi:MAG TPA: c-type cytochrome domain-containing protein [Candidatus Sulfotelmatobacter sp.]|nr:c-type cytochrome domain-containing protein [Candidatus Sulfotelmatobacter sp.]
MLAFAQVCDVALASDTPQPLPPPANVKIVFDRDIRPIFEDSCLRCHVPPKPKSHFRLDDREQALAGGDNNTNDIVPGDSRESLLISYVAGQVPDMQMPPPGRGNPLSQQQVSLLRAWIDQGANWSTTNHPPPPALFLAPMIQGFNVHGNQAKFREIQETHEGVSGGVQNFSYEQTTPDETISLIARAIVPDNNYDVRLALQEAGGGFIHAGFDQWRKYYATDGGYDPAVLPPGFNFNNDLYVDNGRAWADFGFDFPHGTEIVLGYEYQYQKGNEAALDWGSANGVNIFPATQSLDEQTHTLKFDLTQTFDSWRLENNARLAFYTQNNQDQESVIIAPGATPGEFINTGDTYHQTQGMDTLTLAGQFWDWWLINGGFYYSRLSGDDFFNQTTLVPSFSFTSQLSSQQITLSRESDIFSFANLITPFDGATISLATQNEWTRESGFSESIPDLELYQPSGAALADSSLSEFKASQSANVRYTKIPFTVISSDAQFSEDNYGIDQDEDPNELQRQTVANNLRYDLKTGFSTSPWPATDLTMQYERQSSHTSYDNLEDVWLGIPGPANGYPAFILARTITSDQFETKLVLRPLLWLKTTLTYQLTETDYSSETDPFLTPFISPGGFIADGHYDLQTYGISATATPFRRLYFLGAFTFSHSRLETADNGDPSIVPYEGNIITASATATWILSPKASLQFSYYFSGADYAQNNSAAGVPAGLNYQRNDLIAGLTRKLTKNLTGTLRYEFSQYTEPSSGNINNFTANGVMAMLTWRWP